MTYRRNGGGVTAPTIIRRYKNEFVRNYRRNFTVAGNA